MNTFSPDAANNTDSDMELQDRNLNVSTALARPCRFTPGNDHIPILYEAWWAPRLAWTDHLHRAVNSLHYYTKHAIAIRINM
jgi:hypothetical protein